MVAIFADTDKMNFRFFSLYFVFSFVFCLESASALEYLQFRHLDKERSEEGRILLEEPDILVFESREGQYFFIAPKNLNSRKSDDAPFVPYTKAEMIERLQKEFPASEKYYYLDTHDPFIIVYTTSKPFAAWYASLLKKLHEYYVLHWKKKLGVKLAEPEFPMVAIVLSSEEQYRQYAKQDGVTLSKECAYYHKLTNRIVMYDMSGQQVFQEENQRRVSAVDIQRFLRQTGSYHNIMTAIHEAVHQVGYNTGMHPRFAPTPLWLLEGLATLHEVPDLRDRVGWTIGRPHVNRPRLDQLRRYLAMPQQDSPIQEMIKEDKLLKRSDTALEHYALAWGLTYYLVQKRPKELATYLEIMQKQAAFSEYSGKARIKDFESCFGSDWDKFYKDFFEFLRRL